MTLEVFDDYPGDDDRPLPDGCWDENEVSGVVDAVNALLSEAVYEGGTKDGGISVRFLARMTILKFRAGLANAADPLVVEALGVIGGQS